MQTIALWCGIVGLISSILAVIVVILIRKNIVDIIDKNVILFEGNFNTKKDAITNAFNLIDHISTKGKQITFNPEFALKAKHCYNDLLCVVSDLNVVQEFYNIAINTELNIQVNQIENFKLLCRRDIGLKIKKINKSQSSLKENQTFTTPNSSFGYGTSQQKEITPEVTKPATQPTKRVSKSKTN